MFYDIFIDNLLYNDIAVEYVAMPCGMERGKKQKQSHKYNVLQIVQSGSLSLKPPRTRMRLVFFNAHIRMTNSIIPRKCFAFKMFHIYHPSAN